MNILNRLFDLVYDYFDKEPTYIYFKKRVVKYYGLQGIKIVTMKMPYDVWEVIEIIGDFDYTIINKDEYIRLGGEL